MESIKALKSSVFEKRIIFANIVDDQDDELKPSVQNVDISSFMGVVSQVGDLILDMVEDLDI